jgi:hypothetical protein
VPLSRFTSDTFEGFIENFYEKNITYVACNSRGSPKTKGGLGPIREKLVHPQSAGPLKFVKRIEVSKKKWINIFRLQPAPKSQNNVSPTDNI